LDKKTFDIIKKFESIENNLYFKLEKELGQDKADKLLEDFTDYREKLLKIGKYADEESIVDEDGFLTKDFEGFQMYTKVNVYYRYDNGFSLCETTSGLFVFVPSDLISFETV
jgi:hypothetical protein